jgi:hypothetical protein
MVLQTFLVMLRIAGLGREECSLVHLLDIQRESHEKLGWANYSPIEHTNAMKL